MQIRDFHGSALFRLLVNDAVHVRLRTTVIGSSFWGVSLNVQKLGPVPSEPVVILKSPPRVVLHILENSFWTRRPCSWIPKQTEIPLSSDDPQANTPAHAAIDYKSLLSCLAMNKRAPQQTSKDVPFNDCLGNGWQLPGMTFLSLPSNPLGVPDSIHLKPAFCICVYGCRTYLNNENQIGDIRRKMAKTQIDCVLQRKRWTKAWKQEIGSEKPKRWTE